MMQISAARISTHPSIMGKSLLLMAVIINDPSPGMPKIVSTTTEPDTRMPSCAPTVVITGMRALRRACRRMTTLSFCPLARAVVI